MAVCVFLLLTASTLNEAVGLLDGGLVDKAGVLCVTRLQDVSLLLLGRRWGQRQPITITHTNVSDGEPITITHTNVHTSSPNPLWDRTLYDEHHYVKKNKCNLYLTRQVS